MNAGQSGSEDRRAALSQDEEGFIEQVTTTDTLSVDDFELLKVLGKGSFGKVMLVRKNDSQQLYAMKTLRKAELLRRNQLGHTATEREILQNIQSPFLVQLKYAFQTPDKLYMVLDYMGGGELFFWLKKQRRFSEDRVRLYGAEIALALSSLHERDIIYRDLKPENILVGLDGHLKLTDFGLSKEGVEGAGAEGGTKTFCGTPEYLAPEILENRGHGKAVDWWSLGTLMYEMISGLPPFYDTNVQKMYQKILQAPLRFHSHMSRESRDVLGQLLQRRVSERLCSTRGIDELKETPFFAPLDFEQVTALEYEPEFKPPQGRNSMDVSNFDREFTVEKPKDTQVESKLGDEVHFEDFTFDSSNLK